MSDVATKLANQRDCDKLLKYNIDAGEMRKQNLTLCTTNNLR